MGRPRRQRNPRRLRPAAEAIEPRVLLSTTPHRVGSPAARTQAVRQPYSVKQGEATVFSRQAGAATIVIERSSRLGESEVEISTQPAAGAAPSPDAAVPGRQFLPIDQTVTFHPGETQQVVTIPLVPGEDGPDPATLPISIEVEGSRRVYRQSITIVSRADVTGPRAVSAHLIGRGDKVVGARVTFDEPMDPASVSDPRAYVLTDDHQLGLSDWLAYASFRSNTQGDLHFRKAKYDAASNTLTLLLARPVDNLGRYRLDGGGLGIARSRIGTPTDILGNPMQKFSLQLEGKPPGDQPAQTRR